MKVKILVLVLLSFLVTQCTAPQSGTEVVNVLNPTENSPEDRLSVYNFEITVILPEGWSYEEYYPGDEVNDGVASLDEEVDEDTITSAYFTKEDGSQFTVFGSLLMEEENLVDFISARHDNVEDIVMETQTVNGITATLAMIFHEERSAEGHRFVDIYFEANGQILWLRAELVGTDAQQQEDYEEIWDIILNYEVE